MKYLDEFRDGALARHLARAIADTVREDRCYRLMEFCGGHTHAICRYGLSDLLPLQVQMVHGPGCPVCVLPIGRIDQSIRLASERKVTLCTYGDCLRVPGSDGLSLLKAKAQGADVRMVYSVTDAINLARQNPERQIVFLAIGFETTTPATAVAIAQAQALGLKNFSVLCNHVLTPPAMEAIVVNPVGLQIDGFIGPAHVSAIIGCSAYTPFARNYGKPVVIAGFEPLDVMQAILMLVRQINAGRSEVENEFARAVAAAGNTKAQAIVNEVFELRESFEWRGLGTLPRSALRLRERVRAFDAETRFGIDYLPVPDRKACDCGAILRGEKRPEQCSIFATACTPEHPVGACMVSAEGACAAHYSYVRFRQGTQARGGMEG